MKVNKFMIFWMFITLTNYGCWNIAGSVDENKEEDEVKDEYTSYTSDLSTIKKHEKEDFEYSEFWRQEAYKSVKGYLYKIINDDGCRMKGLQYYHPEIVHFIGDNGFRVKVYAEYDCNQNYINKSYFWVETFYIGDNEWNLKLVNQKLTH